MINSIADLAGYEDYQKLPYGSIEKDFTYNSLINEFNKLPKYRIVQNLEYSERTNHRKLWFSVEERMCNYYTVYEYMPFFWSFFTNNKKYAEFRTFEKAKCFVEKIDVKVDKMVVG